MRELVVDTNVLIAANGGTERHSGPRPSKDCRLASIRLLEELERDGRVLVDMARQIEQEYRRHVDPKRQPGVGHWFYLKIVKERQRLVWEVDLPISDDGEFVDFPRDRRLDGFDRSDWKFAALARKTGKPVANTFDSDWLDHRSALREHGIDVVFVCGCDPRRWYEGDSYDRASRRRGGNEPSRGDPRGRPGRLRPS